MAKRDTGLTNKKTKRPHKTKKRIEAKHARLAALASKRKKKK